MQHDETCSWTVSIMIGSFPTPCTIYFSCFRTSTDLILQKWEPKLLPTVEAMGNDNLNQFQLANTGNENSALASAIISPNVSSCLLFFVIVCLPESMCFTWQTENPKRKHGSCCRFMLITCGFISPHVMFESYFMRHPNSWIWGSKFIPVRPKWVR